MAEIAQVVPDEAKLGSSEIADQPGADDCQPEPGLSGTANQENASKCDKVKPKLKLAETVASPITTVAASVSGFRRSTGQTSITCRPVLIETKRPVMTGQLVSSKAVEPDFGLTTARFTCHRLANDSRQLVLYTKDVCASSDDYWLQLVIGTFNSYCEQFPEVELFLFACMHRQGQPSAFTSYCMLSPQGMLDHTIWRHYARYMRDQSCSYERTMEAVGQPAVKQAAYRPDKGMRFYDS